MKTCASFWPKSIVSRLPLFDGGDRHDGLLHNFCISVRTAARMEDANDQWLPADEYYEMPPAPEGILPMSTLGEC